MGAGRSNHGRHYGEPYGYNNIHGFIHCGRLHRYRRFYGNGQFAAGGQRELANNLCRPDRDYDGIRRCKLQLEYRRYGQDAHGYACIICKLYGDRDNGRLLFHGGFDRNGEPGANGNGQLCNDLPGRHGQPFRSGRRFLYLEYGRYGYRDKYGYGIASCNNKLYNNRNYERLLHHCSFNGDGICSASSNGKFTGGLRRTNGAPYGIGGYKLYLERRRYGHQY